MNASNDPVQDRIENADRMLRQARIEHARGNEEDAGEFLAAARRNIDRAAESLKNAAAVLPMHDPRGKGRIEAELHRAEVSHAR